MKSITSMKKNHLLFANKKIIRLLIFEKEKTSWKQTVAIYEAPLLQFDLFRVNMFDFIYSGSKKNLHRIMFCAKRPLIRIITIPDLLLIKFFK